MTRRSKSYWRIKLIIMVGAFLLAVVIADAMKLRNHP